MAGENAMRPSKARDQHGHPDQPTAAKSPTATANPDATIFAANHSSSSLPRSAITATATATATSVISKDRAADGVADTRVQNHTAGHGIGTAIPVASADHQWMCDEDKHPPPHETSTQEQDHRYARHFRQRPRHGGADYYGDLFSPSTFVDPSNVFVKHLPRGTDDEKLRKLFQEECGGDIVSCKVMVHPPTGQSLGYGFVRFATSEQAQRAIERMDGFKIENKRLLCKLSNLSPSSNKDILISAFMAAGYRPDIARQMASAYVEYSLSGPFPTTASAAASPASSLHAFHTGHFVPEHTPSKKLFVTRLPHFVKSECDFRKLFERFEDLITDVNFVMERAGGGRPFGFITFSTEAAASAALQEMNGKLFSVPKGVSAERGNFAPSPLKVEYARGNSNRRRRHKAQGSMSQMLLPNFLIPPVPAIAPGAFSYPYVPGQQVVQLEQSQQQQMQQQHEQQQEQHHHRHHFYAAHHQIPYSYVHTDSVGPYFFYPPHGAYYAYPPHAGQSPMPPTPSISPHLAGTAHSHQSYVHPQSSGQAYEDPFLRDREYDAPGSLPIAAINSSTSLTSSSFIAAANTNSSEAQVEISYEQQSNTDRQRQAESSTNLFVLHLPPRVDDRELERMFSPFGKIKSQKVMLDKITGKSKGYGFVKFYRMQDAVNAISAMNGRLIDNKRLKVSFHDRSSHSNRHSHAHEQKCDSRADNAVDEHWSPDIDPVLSTNH